MFFKKAREGNNNWVFYILTALVCFIGYTIGQIPLMIVLYKAAIVSGKPVMEQLQAFQNDPDFESLGINSNFGFFLLLLMFVGFLGGLYLMVKYLHKKPFIRLITPSDSINWGKIFFGFGFWLLIGLVFEGISYYMSPESYQFSIDWAKFLPLLLISIFILPLQASTEELFFRGYLMPGLGLWLKNKWMPLLITSLMFGVIHSMNPEVGQFGLGIMMAYYISAGLFLGLITIWDDSLELALGVHAATNFFGAVIVGYDKAAIQTDSLFVNSTLNPNLMFVGLLISSIIFIFVASKKYAWRLSSLWEPMDEELT